MFHGKKKFHVFIFHVFQHGKNGFTPKKHRNLDAKSKKDSLSSYEILKLSTTMGQRQLL